MLITIKLLFLAVIITALPLLSKINLSIGHINFQIIIHSLLLGLIVGYSLISKKSLDSKIYLLSLTLTTLITIVSFIGLYPINIVSILRWLIAVWLPGLLVLLIKHHGRDAIILIIACSLAIHAVWGITQFIIQQDLGLTLIGESRLHPEFSGVAKFINSQNQKVIRAYGPYPHANTLAGCLLVGMILINLVNKARGPYVLRPILNYMLFLGMMVAFSRAAMVALGLWWGAVLWSLRKNSKNILNNFIEQKKYLPIALTGLLFIPLWWQRIATSNPEAVIDRFQGSQWAVNMLSELNLWWRGVGLGNYPKALEVFLKSHNADYQPWQIDFVHNTPLVLLVEWGLLPGILLIAAVICFILSRYPLRHQLFLLAISPLLIFDHYLINQTAPLLYLVSLLTLLFISTKNGQKILTNGNNAPASTPAPKSL